MKSKRNKKMLLISERKIKNLLVNYKLVKLYNVILIFTIISHLLLIS